MTIHHLCDFFCFVLSSRAETCYNRCVFRNGDEMKKREILSLVLIVFLDQLTKGWIESTHQLYESTTIIPGFFSLTYARNTGAAWSILEGQQMFFIILTCIVLLGLCWIMVKTPKSSTWTRIAFTLIMAGAIGNFIDRVSFGYVRDFLDFLIFGYDFPIFNVADISLCIGVALLALLTFLDKEESIL